MRNHRNTGAIVVAIALGLVRSSPAEPTPGAVYTMSNGTGGNAVLVFDRQPGGSLVAAGSVATGGLGTGGGLGNQGALRLSQDHRWLFAVNAGSNDVTVFAVEQGGLRWVDRVSSGGTRPVSVTEHDGLVYVLDAGSDSISGMVQHVDGTLAPLPGATQPLSATGTAPAEIDFSPDGVTLLVTEKSTNRLVTYVVGGDGLAGPPTVHASNGATPFGFAFGKRGQVLVSEAGANAVTSYALTDGDTLATLSPSVPTNQKAACWVGVTHDGLSAYATDTGSGAITGYRVAVDGTLALLDADGHTADTGGAKSAPIDLALSGNERYLYSLESTAHTLGVFRIMPDGHLAPLPFVTGLPAGANGLAAQ